MKEERLMRKVAAYLGRATRLRCPVCGKSPIFLPAWRVRKLSDWFTPLDGCPRCGYAFDREPGYFLMSIWAINYGFGSVLGITLYIIFEWNFDWPIQVLLASVLGPILLFNLLFARHSKAYFIAMDHLCDPHRKEGGDEGGNVRAPLPPVAPPPLDDRPEAGEPCETAAGVR